jgi:CO/xanthine dehydrogenase FAD-binding subunit
LKRLFIPVRQFFITTNPETISMDRINYLAPVDWNEALNIKTNRPDAFPLAGGTDILLQMKEGRRHVESLMSLRRVQDAHALRHEEDALVLGPTVKAAQLEQDSHIQSAYTALAMGAHLIGSVQIRNMATVGGNLCNAAPSADMAPPLLVYDTQAIIASANRERRVALTEFFLGPGRTVLAPNELLTALTVPHAPARSGSYYLRHTPRARMDIAVVGVAALVTLDHADHVESARIALGAVAPVPMRALEAENLLIGQTLSDDLLDEVGEAAAQAARPIDDLRASAAFRRHLVSVLTQRALRGAWTRATQNGGQVN